MQSFQERVRASSSIWLPSTTLSLRVHTFSFCLFSSSIFFSLCFSSIILTSIAYLCPQMPAKKDDHGFLHGAQQKGSEECTQGINDAPVHKKVQDKVLREY